MKLTSGVVHPLVGSPALRAAETSVPPATSTSPAAASPRTPSPIPARAGTASRRARSQPAGRSARTPAAARQRTPAGGVALLGVTAAALIGCSSLPSSSWQVQPSYRMEGSGASTVPGHLALARKYEGENRSALALDAYHRAARAAPDDADLQNMLGLALARHGQVGSAVTALRRAVALRPDSAPLLNNLGYALLLDGRSDEARALLRLTLAVDPTHAMAARNLAFIDEQSARTITALSAPTLSPPAAPAAMAQRAASPAALPSLAAVPRAAVLAAVAPSTASTAARPATPPTSAAPARVASTATDRQPDGERLDGVSVEILNGNGIRGAAARLRDWLGQQGVQTGRLANLLPYNSPQTQVLYRPGRAEAAREVAGRMPVAAVVAPAPQGATRADVRVVIGHDVRHSAGCQALAACPAEERVAVATTRR